MNVSKDSVISLFLVSDSYGMISWSEIKLNLKWQWRENNRFVGRWTARGSYASIISLRFRADIYFGDSKRTSRKSSFLFQMILKIGIVLRSMKSRLSCLPFMFTIYTNTHTHTHSSHCRKTWPRIIIVPAIEFDTIAGSFNLFGMTTSDFEVYDSITSSEVRIPITEAFVFQWLPDGCV